MVRHATASDVTPAARALARAFDDDPVTRWVYGERDAARRRWSERFFRWQLRRLLDQDVSWTLPDAGGAALWALPDRWREAPADVVRLLWATLPGIGARVPKVLRGLAKVEARHPRERHLYLAVLGVEPGRQGAGHGSALLRPGLELCDREGLPAYLETATERNVRFYARHGFRVIDDVRLPGGPTVWTLWRDPR